MPPAALPMKAYDIKKSRKSLVRLLFLLTLSSWCRKQHEQKTVSLEEIAANEEVLAFMKTFEGRGALSDSSRPTPPDDALAGFRHADDLNLELVLAEPEITQPLYIDFDHAGS